MTREFRFNRIMLKISGEALKGMRGSGYDPDAIRAVVGRIRAVADRGVEIALVVGAGNLWRGAMGASGGMDRVNADYMGMLATAMNALALKEFFSETGMPVSIYSAIGMEPIVRRFDRGAAIKDLEAGRIVIFAGGTGSPFFTTDTAAVLKALETGCDAVLKATKVDGIYSADPMTHPDAVRFPELGFDEALERNLKVMDSTAFSMCRDNDLPIIVFNFSSPDGFERVLRGDTAAGTIVS